MSDSMDHDAREVIRRRIELRERDGHERLLLNHVDLRALLDAADERDRLADWRDQWQEMRHDAVGEASRRWPEGTIRASRWDGIMIDGERSLLVQREAFVAGAEWVALHEAPQLRSTIERVRALADGWQSRGEHMMAYSKTPEVPGDMADALLDAGAEFVERARLVRNALDGADS